MFSMALLIWSWLSPLEGEMRATVSLAFSRLGRISFVGDLANVAPAAPPRKGSAPKALMRSRLCITDTKERSISHLESTAEFSGGLGLGQQDPRRPRVLRRRSQEV